MKYPSCRLLWLIPLLGLAGCASMIPQPVPKGYDGPLAQVFDTSTAVSSTRVYFFQLARVDGRLVETSADATYRTNRGRGFYMEAQRESRGVPARSCELELEGMTHVAAPILAFGGGLYHVEGKVTVTLEEGKLYYVKGTLSKAYSAVWLEDADGRLVSAKIEKGVPPAAGRKL